jgi:hypothetical protein
MTSKHRSDAPSETRADVKIKPDKPKSLERAIGIEPTTFSLGS